MELLFNYYHGLLTQQQALKNENNDNSHSRNYQYNETQSVIAPEFFTQFVTLLASFNYLEQLKSQENYFTSRSLSHQPILNASSSLDFTQCRNVEVATIKCEPEESYCIEYNEYTETTPNTSYEFISKKDNQLVNEQPTHEDDRTPDKNSERKCKKLKGKESSKRYREKMRSQNILLEKELIQKEKLNERLSSKIYLLNHLKEKLCTYGQELCRLHDFKNDKLKVTNDSSSSTN